MPWRTASSHFTRASASADSLNLAEIVDRPRALFGMDHQSCQNVRLSSPLLGKLSASAARRALEFPEFPTEGPKLAFTVRSTFVLANAGKL